VVTAARVPFRHIGPWLFHQRFQQFVGDDQRLHHVAGITTSSRDCLVSRCFKPVSVGLWIWRGTFRHDRFRVDWTPGMFSLCSNGVKGPNPPVCADLGGRRGTADCDQVQDANGVTLPWIFCRDDETLYSVGANKLTSDKARRLANGIVAAPSRSASAAWRPDFARRRANHRIGCPAPRRKIIPLHPSGKSKLKPPPSRAHKRDVGHRH
jgi:hypothetical protein